jgi:hypothetical protein
MSARMPLDTSENSFIMTTGRDVTSAFVGSLLCAYTGQVSTVSWYTENGMDWLD